MPRCVEVAALIIVELLVRVAGVQAQQQTAPPSSGSPGYSLVQKHELRLDLHRPVGSVVSCFTSSKNCARTFSGCGPTLNSRPMPPPTRTVQRSPALAISTTVHNDDADSVPRRVTELFWRGVLHRHDSEAYASSWKP
jgi:hypothetical protein